MSGPNGETPRESVAELVQSMGEVTLVSRCCEILDVGDVDAEVLVGLAGDHAREILRGREGGVEGYWPRVWALRALLYAWDDVASSSVVNAFGDESWRVREMAAKVTRRRSLASAWDELERLSHDPVPRVCRAATAARTHLDKEVDRR